MPKISIIIRSFNEERWIKYCLEMVYKQEEQDFEVIVVDNNSTDATNDIVNRIGVDKLISIEEYLPGKALNTGIEVSCGKYIVCLSSHCIPENETWLSSLIDGFQDRHIAGIYGRQIPISFSSDNDKRDLLITFGLDRRVQVKDCFFHNANSAIRRDVWETIPFDDKTTNIEDRIWAKTVIDNGMRLLYEPQASVYHHHGIHHGGSDSRLKSTVSILENIEPEANGIPSSMKPENADIAVICPVLHDFSLSKMDELYSDILKTGIHSNIYMVSELQEVEDYCKQKNLCFIKRPENLMPANSTIEDVLSFALAEIEKRDFFPDLILYANYLHKREHHNLFKTMIDDIQYKGLDTVFPAKENYYNLWRKENSNYVMIGDWLPRERREPMYIAMNGLGTVTRSCFVRKRKLIGKKVGLIVIENNPLQ